MKLNPFRKKIKPFEIGYINTEGFVVCPHCSEKYDRQKDLKIPAHIESISIICSKCNTHFDMVIHSQGELVYTRKIEKR